MAGGFSVGFNYGSPIPLLDTSLTILILLRLLPGVLAVAVGLGRGPPGCSEHPLLRLLRLARGRLLLLLLRVLGLPGVSSTAPPGEEQADLCVGGGACCTQGRGASAFSHGSIARALSPPLSLLSPNARRKHSNCTTHQGNATRGQQDRGQEDCQQEQRGRRGRGGHQHGQSRVGALAGAARDEPERVHPVRV